LANYTLLSPRARTGRNRLQNGSNTLHSTPSSEGIRDLASRGYSAARRRSGFIQRSLLDWSSHLGAWSDARYDARRALHAGDLPEVSREQSELLAELRQSGVAVRAMQMPPAVLESAERFIELLRSKPTSEPCAKTTSRELAWDPTLFRWGLSEDLVNLAECHIGLPPRYLGVEVKREMANPAAGHHHDAVRRWHLDHEDRRIFKVIVYLSDVDATSAPFGYVDLPTSKAILEGLGHPFRGARLDEAVRAKVPARDRRQVHGPRMTAIYVDTGQVLHRVFPPQGSERYSLTYAYCGRNPYLTYPQLMLPPAALRELRDELSPRQREALCRSRISTVNELTTAG
jgi:hypothetical protein